MGYPASVLYFEAVATVCVYVNNVISSHVFFHSTDKHKLLLDYLQEPITDDAIYLCVLLTVQ